MERLTVEACPWRLAVDRRETMERAEEEVASAGEGVEEELLDGALLLAVIAWLGSQRSWPATKRPLSVEGKYDGRLGVSSLSCGRSMVLEAAVTHGARGCGLRWLIGATRYGGRGAEAGSSRSRAYREVKNTALASPCGDSMRE
jgi:hypothetical protein